MSVFTTWRVIGAERACLQPLDPHWLDTSRLRYVCSQCGAVLRFNLLLLLEWRR